VQPLTDATRDPELEVRRDVIRSLRSIGDTHAVEPLIQAWLTRTLPFAPGLYANW